MEPLFLGKESPIEHIRLHGLLAQSAIHPVQEGHTLDEALTQMMTHAISSVVVVDEASIPQGIFTEHDALRMIAEGTPKNTPLSQIMTKNPFCVSSSLYLHDAYTQLEERGYRHLIVIDEEGRYEGVVSEGDFLRHMGFDNLSQHQHVGDVMSETPLLVSPQTTLKEAAARMSAQRSDYAILMQDGHPIGIIRERDITRRFATNQSDGSESVNVVAQKELFSIPRHTGLREASTLIEQHGVHQLIITDTKGSIVGVLSRHDVLKAIHGAYFEFLVQTIEHKSDLLHQLTRTYEHALSESDLLESILATIPDLVWLKDSAGVYLTCNRAFEHFFGASRDAIVGKTDFDFVSTDLATFFRANNRLAMATDEPRHNEEFLVFADGSYEGIFDTVKTAMHNEYGEVVGVLGIARDISELKIREEELRRKDQALSEAQTLAQIGSWRFDPKSRRFEWSLECYHIFGLSDTSEPTRESLMERIHPEDRARVEHHWNAALQGAAFECDHRLIVDGKIKWVRERAQLEADENSALVLGMGTVQDITRQKNFESRLEALANFDTLTGFANRSLLLSHLGRVISKTRREGGSTALLIFDLDRFKDVNDSYGHAAGDELLTLVAERFRERFRHHDFLSRLGGDEFAVVIENLPESDNAALLAQEMIHRLSQPYTLEGNTSIHISASVGIALSPQHATDAQTLLQYADTALYRAKNEGRGIFCYYTDDLTQSAKARIESTTHLREALSRGEFCLYYQPQVHLSTGRRSADPLDSSTTRHDLSAGVHSDGRRERADQSHRCLGDRGGVQARQNLAGQRLSSTPLAQCLGLSGAPSRSPRSGRVSPAPKRILPRQAHARTHRKCHDGAPRGGGRDAAPTACAGHPSGH